MPLSVLVWAPEQFNCISGFLPKIAKILQWCCHWTLQYWPRVTKVSRQKTKFLQDYQPSKVCVSSSYESRNTWSLIIWAFEVLLTSDQIMFKFDFFLEGSGSNEYQFSKHSTMCRVNMPLLFACEMWNWKYVMHKWQ